MTGEAGLDRLGKQKLRQRLSENGFNYWCVQARTLRMREQEESEMRQGMIVAAVIGVVLGAGQAALADGCPFVAERGAALPVTSSRQQGYLIHFDGWETLCLQANYRGPVADVAWVVPVPSDPEIGLGDFSTLEAMEEKTRPQVVIEKLPQSKTSCEERAPRPADMGKPGLGVELMKSAQVGDLEVQVIDGKDGAAVAGWLREHGYRVPAEAPAALDGYVRRGFKFVVAQVRAERAWQGEEAKGKEGLFSGTLLKLRFRSEKPYYPLALSRLAAAEETEIILFTVTEHRLLPEDWATGELRHRALLSDVEGLAKQGATKEAQLGPMRQALAGMIGPGLVTEAALPTFCEFDENGRPSMVGLKNDAWGRYLRKAVLGRWHTMLKPVEMRRDIYFERAPTDARYDGAIMIKVSGAWGGPAALAALVLPVGLLAGRKRKWRRVAVGVMIVLVALA